MSLTLPPDVMESVVAKAILDTIGPEERDRIVADAVAHMLLVPEKKKPTASTWGGQPEKSLLRIQFESAIEGAIARTVRDAVDNDPAIQAGIVAAVSPVLAELAAGNYQGLPEVIGSAVGTWLQDRVR